SRSLRVFFFWAASRKRMAAHWTTLKRRRLSRWMMTGIDSTPPVTAAADHHVSKRKARGSMAASSQGIAYPRSEPGGFTAEAQRTQRSEVRDQRSAPAGFGGRTQFVPCLFSVLSVPLW